MHVARGFRGILTVGLFLTIVSTTHAKYSGGTGEPNDPYQIATAADLIALGEDPNDYGKHFLLTADIDLDPNLPGRKVFGKAVIAPDTNDPTWDFEGTWFTGVFDGSGHAITHLTIRGNGYLGLFGCLSWPGEVRDLAVLDVSIVGSGVRIGALAGSNEGGHVNQCYSTGVVRGGWQVGGLVGENAGDVMSSCAIANVTGAVAGGLAGANGRCSWANVYLCGGETCQCGTICNCYSTGSVVGDDETIGGLVGSNVGGTVVHSYSSGKVKGRLPGGGLVAVNTLCWNLSYPCAGHTCGVGHVVDSFWDTQTSGQTTSDGGTGRTTAEMRDPNTFRAAGWDFVGQADGPSDFWAMSEGGGYPILWWQLSPWPSLPRFCGGTGEPNDPYVISTAKDLNSIGHNPRLMKCHFRLVADLDLSPFDGKNGRPVFNIIGHCYLTPVLSYPGWDYHLLPTAFSGVFDGNRHTVSHLTVENRSASAGLFGGLASEGQVKNLGVVDVNMTSSGDAVGGLVGVSSGTVTRCYSSGVVRAGGAPSEDVHLGYLPDYVGGLVGDNSGSVTDCYSTAAVNADEAGGLCCFSAGGLAGRNSGTVISSYSAGAVSGSGGDVGGLVGENMPIPMTAEIASFWDSQTSGQAASAGGTGKTTAEMQTAKTFLDAGWDFVGETANGPKDIWKIVEGQSYPLLSWQKYSGGTGEPNDPYQIATAADLIALGETPEDYDKHFILTADIDLDPNLPGRKVFDKAVTAPDVNDIESGFQGIPFTGVFDGNGHRISHLTICGDSDLGLFGCVCGYGTMVKSLGVSHVNIMGSRDRVGGLVGTNEGAILADCYSTGVVSGNDCVGGLVGHNLGPEFSSIAFTHCYSAATVDGNNMVGGLAGLNRGSLTDCYSTGVVDGNDFVGGLVGATAGGTITNCHSMATVSGRNGVAGLIGLVQVACTSIMVYPNISWSRAYISHSYSAGAVTGENGVGGLVGCNLAGVNMYDMPLVGQIEQCFWDTQASGQTTSDGGTGKTTAEMQMASTFIDAGWDFAGETANGTEDIWWIDEGKDYPRLWWEQGDEASPWIKHQESKIRDVRVTWFRR